MAVYLICFDRPYQHARHYLGWAKSVDARLAHHRRGTGANLIRVIQAAGIGWQCVRVWPDGDRAFERKLKTQSRSAQLCPRCNAAYNARRRERKYAAGDAVRKSLSVS